jgi:hypothetical protein
MRTNGTTANMADVRLCALLIGQRREVDLDEENAEPANRWSATVLPTVWRSQENLVGESKDAPKYQNYPHRLSVAAAINRVHALQSKADASRKTRWRRLSTPVMVRPVHRPE